MATIRPIEDRTIHQIQSGQVIVDLCSVVKELVENSLDARATSIEVRFKNQGLDLIEVHDNGGGISPDNYETVALKHHTSKLSSYSDLSTLLTFGFRGEALSSLCALSNFTIVTCMAADVPKGTKLEFKTSGALKGTSVVAAQKGTTVSVENLFNNLPVRRRELERNIKREWNKVIAVLNQYACIQTGVKILVTQQSVKGKNSTIFSTKGNPTTRENIVNIFGAKTLTALLPMDLKLELEPTGAPSQRLTTQDDGGKNEIRIVGHISRPVSGEGRQTPDRQMFFVNSRPCGLPQVAKVFNEVYKSYNSTQSPFIFANIEMDTHLYDVNVSPDKRTILLHDQSRMLEHLKTSLTALFESQDYTVPISQLPAQKLPQYKQMTLTRSQATQSQMPREPPVSSGYSTNDDSDSPSQNADSEAATLLSKWAVKKAGAKDSEIDPRGEHTVGLGASLSAHKQMAVKSSTDEPIHVSGAISQSTEETETETVSPMPSYIPPILVQDFNKDIDLTPGEEFNKCSEGSQNDEEPIPAIPSPARLSALNRLPTTDPKLRKAPPTTATITIGGHTVTNLIGMPSPKKARIESRTVVSSAATKSTFGSRLSQRFSAPYAPQQDFSDLAEFSPPENENLSLESDEISTSEAGDGDVVEEEISSDHSEGEMQAQDSEDGSDMKRSTISLPDEPHDPDDPEDSDAEYVDDDEKKAQEDAKVQDMIKLAEEESSRPSDENKKRAQALLIGGARRKDKTVHLVRIVHTTVEDLDNDVKKMAGTMGLFETTSDDQSVMDITSDSDNVEERLSLTINKTDFAKMKVVGQFNLGFILATRTGANTNSPVEPKAGDDLFIIDQHASDEKYNFERLQATTIVQSQRLVRPKTLDLTAVEEEIVRENLAALETNGFIVTVDDSGDYPIGQRCQLVSLPLSRETTFSLTDLDELIALLADYPSGSVPRPSKVRKMFAMRACRSSIMIGRTLTQNQMEKAVRHMGEIDKPWNCPHGRPTMRHLCSLGAWDEAGWKEGDGLGEEKEMPTDWASWIREKKATRGEM